jgi:hypothetical protein
MPINSRSDSERRAAEAVRELADAEYRRGLATGLMVADEIRGWCSGKVAKKTLLKWADAAVSQAKRDGGIA